MDQNIQDEIEQMAKELSEGGLDVSWLPRRVSDWREQQSIHQCLKRRMPGHKERQKRRQERLRLESPEVSNP